MLEPTFRPLITVIRITPDRSSVEVALDMDGRTAVGFGEITDDDSVEAACRATVDAVQSLLPERLELTLSWFKVLAREDGSDVINSAVDLRVDGRDQSEQLLGAAYVRHDMEVAAVRATLDGLTRRLVDHIFG